MRYDSDKHHRRSLRLKGYDYGSAGAYFITICAYQRRCLFGEIIDGKMHLNEFGQIAACEWVRSETIRKEIECDEWIIMPNHVHGIVFIHPIDTPKHPVGANGRLPLPRGASTVNPNHRAVPPMKPQSLSSFVARYKSAVTKRINVLRDAPGTPVWQRNFYDHIIRNEASLHHIRQYVQTNPLSWRSDQLHPDRP